ncbi:inositol monophosphatase [Arcanobacterium haemolyticum]|nr:inositol monophosphatase [Arcanobacterium haemolyticum]
MKKLADIAEKAARSVGPYLTDAFQSPGLANIKTDFHDIVTVHDTYAQRAIVDLLLSDLPDSVVVGEESDQLLTADGPIGMDTSLDEDTVRWYVDPIDGTSNFASGFDHWCVSIAAQYRGELVAGVLYQPTTGTMYRADQSGAYKNNHRISIEPRPLRESMIITQFPSARVASEDPEAANQFLKLLAGCRSVRRPGSTALALAEVASGHFIATFNRHTHPWDVAGGIVILRKAGGAYFGFDDDGILTSDLANARNYVAAATPEAAEFCFNVLGYPFPRDEARAFTPDLPHWITW